jgi:hypothetical protein
LRLSHAFLAFAIAAPAAAAPSPALAPLPRAFACHPQGRIVSVDTLKEGGFRRLTATLTMSEPVGEAPPIVAIDVESPDRARDIRLTGTHAGPKDANTPWTRIMRFQLEELGADGVVLRHSDPAYVYFDSSIKIIFESGPNGAYSFKLVSSSRSGGETEQSATLTVESMPQKNLVLLCLGTDFELTDLRIE